MWGVWAREPRLGQTLGQPSQQSIMLASVLLPNPNSSAMREVLPRAVAQLDKAPLNFLVALCPKTKT